MSVVLILFLLCKNTESEFIYITLGVKFCILVYVNILVEKNYRTITFFNIVIAKTDITSISMMIEIIGVVNSTIHIPLIKPILINGTLFEFMLKIY